MDTTAIDTLRSFLSEDNLNVHNPQVYSPNAIRSLYYSAESRNQLGKLESRMLSTLIGLFGSLSVDPLSTLVYRVPLASHLVRVSKPRSHWSFVLKVGKFKQQSGMTLSDSDRFWLLRAELATARTLISAARPEGFSDNLGRAISRARVHYRCIRRHSYHPEVHVPYLQTLVDSGSAEVAAADLAFALRTHQICHMRLLAVLYRLIVKFGGELSVKAQACILSALWTRIHHAERPHSSFESGNDEYSRTPRKALDAPILAHGLSTALLGPYNLAASGIYSYVPKQQLAAVFCPMRPLTQRWTALILLALFNAPQAVTNGSSLQRCTVGSERSFTASFWEVIYGLATLERMFMGPFTLHGKQTAPIDDIRGTARALLQTWSRIVESPLVSHEAACGISASFFRIGGRGGDALVIDGCRTMCDHRGIWPQDLLEGRDLNTDFMVAQYIAASVRIHGVQSSSVLRVVNAFSPDSKRQWQVFDVAVEELAGSDPRLAYALHAAAIQSGKDIASNVTHTLVLSLLKQGYLEDAIRVLTQNQFSEKQLETVLASMARRIQRDRLGYRSDITQPIVHQLLSMYKSHSPSERFRRHFEQLLLVLCQNGKGRQMLRVVSFVMQTSPMYFKPMFFSRLCTVLLRHKQFRGAGTVAAIIAGSHPITSHRLRLLVTSAATRARVSRAQKLTRIHLAPSGRRCHGWNLDSTSSPQKTRGGSMPRNLSSHLCESPYHGLALEQVMQELVSLGRTFAARRLFVRSVPTLTPKRCTTLGNILLHGVSCQPKPRNGRLVRKLLVLVEELVKRHAFRPDRVTVNIIVKTMINWRSVVDNVRLRVLFDQLVRGGYPAADHSPQRPPFGTPPTPSPGSLGLSKLTPSISFERHARPLYKMFIKAFYLRHDIEAARRIIWILKVEEQKDAIVKEKRWRGKSKGRIKASRVSGRGLEGGCTL
ncbi:hypothetical protein F5I97DRAFT_1812117 [Phlebopus sp. FC_14]|nr:hypothetical protein F5I97DRAFT_1812117 [Phlebopus sp. FC_14]